jgi:uncharacterized protein YqgQ
MIVKKPLMYYDNIELVEFRYGDLLLPSDVYNYVQDGIKTSSTVIVPTNFFEYWDDGKDAWYFKPKEYLTLYSTIHNEKGIRLFIAPMLNDGNLMPFIKFPKGIDEYVDKDPKFYDTGWMIIDRKNDSWVVRKKIYMDLNEIYNVAKYKGEGKTFFFGILTYFPDVEYKVAFSDSEVNKALSMIPKEVYETMNKSEISWVWLLNYLDDVRVVYLFGKGHDVAVGYAVTDWLAYFVAGVIK